MVKAYLFKMLSIKNITSVVLEKHAYITRWYYIHITIDERTCKLFVTSSGVVSVDGSLNWEVLELINAINYLMDSDYYSILQRHMIVDLEDFKMNYQKESKQHV